MKFYPKRRRPKKCAVSLNAADARRIDTSNDDPMAISPPAWSFVDWGGLIFILGMIALAFWGAFGLPTF